MTWAALVVAAAALPFPLEPGTSWIYREAYAEKRGAIDSITEDETSFELKGKGGRLFVEQRGGADPAGLTPIEWGEDWIRLGPWTGDEPLPLPVEMGRRGHAAEGEAAWVVEAEEDVTVPAGSFRALRCAFRTWRSESLLWIAPGVGVVRETQGAPGQRPEIERVLLRVEPRR